MMAEKIRERTKIDEGTRTKLQSFFERGMTRVGSPLVEEASSATGLDISIIENWIGNYKRAFKSPPNPPKPKLLTRDLSAYNLFCRDVLKKKGTLKDVREWSSLGQEDRERYKQEAAALKTTTKPQDFSPGMRALKIKRHIKQLKLEVSKLEELGVETAALSVDCLNPMTSVLQVSSKNAAAFLEETDTANKFALKMSASCCSSSPAESVHELVKKVQDLFNQKYIAAGGSGRLPYQALANQTLVIEVQGLPTDLTLRKPSFYGRKQLEMILKAADQISFRIKPPQVNTVQLVPQGVGEESELPVDTMECTPQAEDAGGHAQTAEEIFASMFDDGAAAGPSHSPGEVVVGEAVVEGTSNACCVCGADFYDLEKNSKKKWRSWSQCCVCNGWSHTACGFKRNMCAKCYE